MENLLKQRILILDGAMGTMIQKYQLTEEDYRGERFSSVSTMMKGNNDILCLTQPSIISEIHAAYLEAGADIIETNTFNATSVSMEDYNMQEYVREINLEGARIAKSQAQKYSLLTPDKPRFVAGSIGPTNKTCSMSPDVNNPAFRALSFDDLTDTYREQIEALLEGGVDLLLIETIFDTLNAKAALLAAKQAMRIIGRKVPVMLSVTVSDKAGRTLSGQTLAAFLTSVAHADILSVGLNCSFGAKDMKPFLEELSSLAPHLYISAYPNAGLPNRFGEYDETPEMMAEQLRDFVDHRIVNILGGCCGTTPEHILAYNQLIANKKDIRTIHKSNDLQLLELSGLERLKITPANNFVNIGERCNVAGSRKFLRLIKERQFDEALSIARKQVEDGAQIIDINMDDAMLEAVESMTEFVNLVASDPDISKVPMMIDSSKWEVIESGLKCLQGKSIVNSISLKEGEQAFLMKAMRCKDLGAAVVVMAFDENGQADTFERKTEVCERAYRLLTQKGGFAPTDIIFDPNVLAVATGIEEHRKYGSDFIRATEWIKQNLPGAKVSGGLSNLSFSFRGNNYIREAMHAVFLYHAIAAGLDMAIVNPAESVSYNDIPKEVLDAIEDVLFDRHEEATERLIEIAEAVKDAKTGKSTIIVTDEWRNESIEERLKYALIKGIGDYLESDLQEAILKYPKAIDIIEHVLMEGMNEVGVRFGEGRMFLPQVVKTARTMKKAVSILEPVIQSQKAEGAQSKAGKIIIATVKGDVHDIGKNIVGVILACNNFEVIDLGVMVPHETIVEATLKHKPDFVGLSGLITPSLDEMCTLARMFEEKGINIPILVGGATTSKLHTAVKVAPLYSHGVIHGKDASQMPGILSKWMNIEQRTVYLSELNEEYERLRNKYSAEKNSLTPDQAFNKRLSLEWSEYKACKPNVEGEQVVSVSINEILPFINWKMFFYTWKFSAKFASILHVDADKSSQAKWILSFKDEEQTKASEALQLFWDAQAVIIELLEKNISLTGLYRIFEAYSSKDSLIFNKDGKNIEWKMKRQTQLNSKGQTLSLTDFVSPQQDFVGAFAVSEGIEFENLIKEAQAHGDDYKAMLLQTIADRLVEATAEWLHMRIRREFWGYASDESIEIGEVMKGHYQGIRPAVGYPSIPEQQTIHILGELIDFSKINIRITENGAMAPAASVSGLYIMHPESTYFII
ncbi:MAG: methionine synthase [Bacteroidales bacterium]